ncbi:ComF family protein [Cohnella endophytica]|uniref:ComF family protein n=1 Tax=Cohnella endophytica TaxID=2419778 RepID=A0A494XCC1_9BACL|nr:ComF family protein [Cohnella endophytica]RKP47261.1 ComF family protein [Cohnella endophytica]
MSMNFSSWFSPSRAVCPMCGNRHTQARIGIANPLKHPDPRRIIDSLCGSCRHAIPWIVYPACRICGRAERCEDCLRRKIRHYELSRCGVRYDKAMKDWLALYKYRGHEGVENVLAAMLAFAFERLGEATKLTFHGITAVPLAPERLRERNFNQAERLAQRLSEWYGLSYSPMLLRLRHTEKQSLKTRRSRVTDMRGNFAADPAVLFSERASPHRIIIVDDVYTTGSTLDECARILKQAMPNRAEVYGLLWARS